MSARLAGESTDREPHSSGGDPLKKPIILTLGLLFLSLPFLLGVLPGYPGGSGLVRTAFLWTIPVAAGLLAAIVYPRLPADPSGGFSRTAALRLLPWCAAGFLVEYGSIGLGHLAGWVTFTFGDQWLYDRLPSSWIWGVPTCAALGILGLERALRRTLLAAWAGRLRLPAAALMSGATGVVVSLPGFLGGPDRPDADFVFAALVASAAREVACTVIFLSGGGILLAGAYRGFLLYFDTLVLNDWSAVAFPAANLASSDPRFYLLREGCSIASAAVIGWGAWRLWRPSGRALAATAS